MQPLKSATAEALTPNPGRSGPLWALIPAGGRLAWQHPPLSMEVTDFEDAASRQSIYLDPGPRILSWSPTSPGIPAYAESGCGFIVRSDGEEENSNQYFIGLTRGAEGHVLFGEQVNGEVNLDEVTDIYANGIDPLFEWQNDTTNRLAVVGQGQEFTILAMAPAWAKSSPKPDSMRVSSLL